MLQAQLIQAAVILLQHLILATLLILRQDSRVMYTSPILPQYSKVGGNNSQHVNDKITNETLKYTTNDTIDYDYSIDGDKYKSLSITTANTKADSSVDNNKGATDNIKNKKIQSNTIESMMYFKS